MLRPVVQDVLESSALVAECQPVADQPLRLDCAFVALEGWRSLDLQPLLTRLADTSLDPQDAILAFADRFLTQGDPARLYPLRARLRPLVRSRDFVARAEADQALEPQALFPVPGFPDLVAFTVLDDVRTVELLRDPEQGDLRLEGFAQAYEQARRNATWLAETRGEGGTASLLCPFNTGDRPTEQARYCSLRLDGFYESSLLVLDDFAAWLRGFVDEPCLIAVPAREEVLVVPLSDLGAVRDLARRLQRLRPFAVSHSVAFWSGAEGAGLEAVDEWALQRGLLFRSKTIVRKADGVVLTFDH